ncbi:MAG: L-histidine N(alpha)-methyltransferase [Bdellovibrionales bacterium]|nr:L-histidine N(alpha)-methyltransferase [Bdellovibrionales bacterium]
MGNIAVQSLKESRAIDPAQELALSVLEGLSGQPKSLPSKLFYDDKGSELFKKIMHLPEYYPTSCEAEILGQQGAEVAKALSGQKVNLIELGCGDGAKTILLLNHLLQNKVDLSFVPLDISRAAIDFLIENLKREYGEIPFDIQGLVSEYFGGLSWLTENQANRNLVLFLGSNIGNFNEPTAMRFLRHLWHSLNDGDLVLIGFDLKKDLDVMYNAYNDSQGVTKEFNLNVLDRINSVLGADFNRSNFQHQGLYDVKSGAMESYLIAQSRHTVMVEELGKEFQFLPWEPIHMEYSYKYLPVEISDLASSTGFEIVENFKDQKGYFIDSLWKVKK